MSKVWEVLEIENIIQLNGEKEDNDNQNTVNLDTDIEYDLNAESNKWYSDHESEKSDDLENEFFGKTFDCDIDDCSYSGRT